MLSSDRGETMVDNAVTVHSMRRFAVTAGFRHNLSMARFSERLAFLWR